MMKRFPILLAILSLTVLGAGAADDFEWLPGATYDAAVPTPEAVLGHPIGTFLTDHRQMEEYIHRLAEASARVRVLPLGRSVERREMYLLIISSPENLARLEDIRSSVERLSDPRGLTSEEADRLIRGTVPIAWLNYANDGGETAAFEAGLLMAYQLAAGTDPLTTRILKESVVIINPAANPDSHQRFVAWMKANTIGPNGTADPAASEHHVPWFLSSDGNHYLIDSNRDAFALTQPETRTIAAALQHWHPQVWIDNHGEPDEYYFAPFCTPMNLNYPADLRNWATEIGKSCARYFDRFGWTFARDEVFDLYFPGYWDSYPAFNGAISATYETNGGGWKNLAWRRTDGSVATLREGIHGHFIADLAALETLVDHSAGILRYFYDFFRTGMEEVDREALKAVVLLPQADEGRRDALVRLLLRHGIEVYRLREAIRSGSASDYFDRTPRALEAPAGSYLIPLRQPRKRLIKTLLEPDPKLEQAFLDQVEATAARNSRLGVKSRKESLGFYDVTAWALPLSYGVDSLLLSEEPSLAGALRVVDPPRAEARVEGAPARYAYLFTYESDAGGRLAGRLLQEGFHVALATRPFSNAGHRFPSGTFVVRVERNPGNLHERIRELASECAATVFGVQSAGSDEGPSLGSETVVSLQAPRILVFSDEPTRAVAFGAIYSLLEQRFGLQFTAVRADYFDEVELAGYNVIILPDGSADGYRQRLGDEGIRRLGAWVRDGGVLLGIKGGAEFTTLADVGFVDVAVSDRKEPDGEADSPAQGTAAPPIEWHPGSLFRVRLNTDYPLGFGYPAEIAVQFRGNKVFSPSTEGTNVALFPESSYLQGHRWEDTEKILSGHAYLSDVPLGRGHVILFADDPTFRASWRGLDRLFLSGILFGKAL